MAITLFDFIEIKWQNLNDQIRGWMKSAYNKSDIVLNPASPYGQILSTQEELFQHNLIHLKYVANQLDIETTDNKTVIRSVARIAGHNATRSIAASGTIKMRLKTGISIENQISSDKIIIKNETLLKNNTNGLFYTILLNDYSTTFSVKPDVDYYFNVIQGQYETVEKTGNGTINQSFNIPIPNGSNIDNFEIYVSYNGTQISIKDSMTDLLPNEYACYVKTGINGGVDVYFGNSDFGFVPINGGFIEIKYLKTDGNDGNLFNQILNDFIFIDQVVSDLGEIVNMDTLFDIYTETNINMGSDGESATFTKNILPYVSRNYILATPDQFVYHLTKMNIFSKVNAFNLLNDHDIYEKDSIISSLKSDISKYILNDVKKQDMIDKLQYIDNLDITNDNKIFLYLIPNIKNFFDKNTNYYNIPFDVFYLDDTEQQKILTHLRKMATQLATVNVEIIQPKITRYVMNVILTRFKDTPENNIRNEIISKTSDFFINYSRFDRIIKADLITLLKNIQGIDSVDVVFISEKNEIYHSNDTTSSQVLGNPLIANRSYVQYKKDYDQNIKIGIDTAMGDILIKSDELPIIRGGWFDRNNNYYAENPDENGLTSINISFVGTSDRK